MELGDLIRDNVRCIKPYSPGKDSEEAKREYGLQEVVKLASNENPLGPSPAAVEAIRQAAEQVYLYPDPTWRELKLALAERFRVEPECVLVGRGSDELIHLAGLALVEPGEEIVFSDPPFALYPLTAALLGARPVAVPARDFTHDLEAMAAACTERTRLLFISNPYNPTGTIVRRAEVERLLDRVPERTVVVLDEAYFEYVDDPDYPDSLQYVREGRRVLGLRTFSKIYALAGLRVGYGFAPPALADGLRRACPPFNVSSLALAAALASLGDEQQVRRSQRLVWEGRAYLYRECERLGLTYVPTFANFLFLDLGRDSREVFEALLRRGVSLRTGDVFGLPTWVRVTFGTPDQNRYFVEQLEAVLAEG